MTTAAHPTDSRRTARSRLPLPLGALLSFAGAVAALVCIAALSYAALQSSMTVADRVAHSVKVGEQLQTLSSNLKDAETGQRGFLLTGNEIYLAPYIQAKAAIPMQLRELRVVLEEDALQQQRLEMVSELANDKLTELGETILKRRAGDEQGALAMVRTDRGKLMMDRVRVVLADMLAEERRMLAAQEREAQDVARVTMGVTVGGSLFLLALVVTAGITASREHRASQRANWLSDGQTELSARMVGEQRLQDLGSSVLEFLASYLDAQVGAVYVAGDDGGLRPLATYGVMTSAAGSDASALKPGDGLLGQAAKDNRSRHVRDVPAGYLRVTSTLGEAEPAELLVSPASVDGEVQAVIELGFFRRLGTIEQALLDRISGSLGVALRTAKHRTQLEELLGQTQIQAEELQTQQEELRVNNEELEEQGNVLRESQAELEAQHEELEETNSRLAEQTRLLERQRDDLNQSRKVLEEKAAELERASTYKSEFLANMSHELRTPLNSSLILSKLLADNRDGKLSADQVKYARSIHSAGKELLALINDILDLAKIEAGKVELHAEPVLIAPTFEALLKTFQPIALEKGLSLVAEVAEGMPERLETDGRRLGQILKNLLSNALKFTETGGTVTLRATPAAAGMFDFSVADDGIGIPPHQQGLIFDAFRQADGSTHRKYGGTGLGLSISRDLARLLGGDLTVRSDIGAGSVFTLTLPRVRALDDRAAAAAAPGGAALRPNAPSHDAAGVPPFAGQSGNGESAAVARSPAPLSSDAPDAVGDDRDRLTPDARVILVIEDDPAFAIILRDLAHELGFQCVVTHAAADGLAAAIAYRPAAVLLDVNLPDHSGLGVLEQLKRSPDTRHIPVHVSSGADYTREALQLGATGYALKPVPREHLVKAIRRLEAKMAQTVKRVLVVEDDDRQRDSIRLLLGSAGVEITGVASAAEALDALQATTFDCMVMDLNLPDLSGYELLEKIATHGDWSFPPVIVYTGRELSSGEEQQLRRYSDSIIIKDDRSPERLLDEVTLFIHQVEAKLPVDRQQMLKASRDRDVTLQGRRILIVEDDVRNIFALTGVLEPEGVQLETARNGREALEVLTRHSEPGASRIDLVLMDIMMPEMDGLTAIREIRKRPDWKKLPVIALTARAMKGDQERCFDAGANDYITKPIDIERLLSLVRVWIPK